MAVDSFIPEIWAAELLRSLRKTLVFGQPALVNTDYEGDISDVGNTVRINTIGGVTVFDYVKNSDMPAPQELTTTSQLLQITQSKAFNFQVDDVDKAQAKPGLMQAGMEEASYALADVADTFIYSQMRSGLLAANSIGTAAAPVALTAANIYGHLVDLGVLLSNARVPFTGRWIVGTPKLHGLLQKAPEFVRAGDLGDDVVVNGRVGRIAGFDVMESHNIGNIGTGAAGDLARKVIVAGNRTATSYAEQINKTEAYKPERRFGDAVKGLHLYGAKVVKPAALAGILATADSV